MYLTQKEAILLQNWYDSRLNINNRIKISLQDLHLDYKNYCLKKQSDYLPLGKIKFHSNLESLLSKDNTKNKVIKHHSRDGVVFFGLCLNLKNEEITGLIKKVE